MRVVLRGRRTFLLWSLTWLGVIGVSLSALTVAFGSPLPAVLRAQFYALQTQELVQVVAGYGEGQRAALLTLEDDVLAQLPLFAQGEALEQLLQQVAALRAGGFYQAIEVESFEVVQVLEEEAVSYVVTNEVITLQTFSQAGDGFAPSESTTVSLQVVYHLAREAERWKITKIVAVELPEDVL